MYTIYLPDIDCKKEKEKRGLFCSLIFLFETLPRLTARLWHSPHLSKLKIRFIEQTQATYFQAFQPFFIAYTQKTATPHKIRDCGNYLSFYDTKINDYSMIVATRPDPTVRLPSRNRTVII